MFVWVFAFYQSSTTCRKGAPFGFSYIYMHRADLDLLHTLNDMLFKYPQIGGDTRRKPDQCQQGWDFVKNAIRIFISSMWILFVRIILQLNFSNWRKKEHQYSIASNVVFSRTRGILSLLIKPTSCIYMDLFGIRVVCMNFLVAYVVQCNVK